MVNCDKSLLKVALENAWNFQGLTFPNPAVGAVITDSEGNILSIGTHQYAGGPHAEVNAIKQAYIKITNDNSIKEVDSSVELHKYISHKHNNIFHDKKIYVTLEPCNHTGKTPPCAKLIETLGFKEIIIGAMDINPKATGGSKRLEKAGLQVKKNILQEECEGLLEPFSTWIKKPFIFFKLALSKNSVVTGGVITSLDSRRHVHNLRDKCDLLVIGGNTVRIDRPTLDARLVDGKAPDVLIYSKKKEFDMSIPLFKIPNRKVYIENNLDKIQEYKYIMIEGGEGMLKAMKSEIDWFLFYRSPHEKNGIPIEIDISLDKKFSISIGEDVLTWYKKID